jgi:tRNA modification GTPase
VWDLPPEIRSRISPTNTVVVLNKADLPAAPRVSQTFGFSPVEVSATIGTGIHQLEEALVQLAESMRSEVGAELIAINARHAGALNEAKLHLTRCAGNLAGDNASELLASDLRCALECFGQLAGRIDNERVLDVLFSQFCIGK